MSSRVTPSNMSHPDTSCREREHGSSGHVLWGTKRHCSDLLTHVTTTHFRCLHLHCDSSASSSNPTSPDFKLTRKKFASGCPHIVLPTPSVHNKCLAQHHPTLPCLTPPTLPYPPHPHPALHHPTPPTLPHPRPVHAHADMVGERLFVLSDPPHPTQPCLTTPNSPAPPTHPDMVRKRLFVLADPLDGRLCLTLRVAEDLTVGAQLEFRVDWGRPKLQRF